MIDPLTNSTPEQVIDGYVQAVEPLKVRHLARFITLCEPIAGLLMQGDIRAVLLSHTEAVIEATALGAEVERAWLNDQDVEVLVRLANQVIAVNADFFTQRLLPQLSAAANQWGDPLTSTLPSPD